jgi:16S rRNA processing protein RimM
MNSEVVSKKAKNAPNAQINPGDVLLVAIAKIGRPYGLTGAMHVFPYSTDAATLRHAKEVTVRTKSSTKTYDVKSLRAHGDAYVMTLEGIASPEAAAAFTNAEIAVSRDAFPALPKGEFYWVDLVGLRCANVAAGNRAFGTIVEVFEVGAHPILRVRAREDASERVDELIPFVDAIIRSVDLEARLVDVDWEGLHGADDGSTGSP